MERRKIYPDTMAVTKTTITDDELLKISSANPELRFELVDGELIAMPPLGSYSGHLESEYNAEVVFWCRKHQARSFSSSTGFRLPNGNVRSPDVAVVLSSHPSYGGWVTTKSKTFFSGPPDFLIEIRSVTDSLTLLKSKMTEWMESGCRLAFLIDPNERKCYVYRGDRSITEYPYEARLSGEDVLPGFEICPAEIDPAEL